MVGNVTHRTPRANMQRMACPYTMQEGLTALLTWQLVSWRWPKPWYNPDGHEPNPL